jgi:hypothetical protein
MQLHVAATEHVGDERGAIHVAIEAVGVVVLLALRLTAVDQATVVLGAVPRCARSSARG